MSQNPAQINSKHNPIDSAKAVIRQEIDGLEALVSYLDDRFCEAVELIAGLKGRVIVSGMGKSGHIARKMAATFASTGTPAFFVHPGEASHGDLGMITKDDGLILLSNSGETAELKDMVAYSRRFRIPLIAIVRRKTSTLVQDADIALVLPEIPEASPVDAPTTSTTMMLALGDALAIALLEKRGFTKTDFGVFHPGGKLGKAFIKASEIMHSGDALPLVPVNAGMDKVILEMTSKGFGCAGVLNAAGELEGIITDGDLRRHLNDNLLAMTARKAMTANPKTIQEKTLAIEALGIMNEKSITSLFVVNGNKPVGILHIHDCLRAGIA